MGRLLVGLLVARPTLDENGTTWWIGAAAVGVVSGLGGLVFLRWRKRRGAPLAPSAAVGLRSRRPQE